MLCVIENKILLLILKENGNKVGINGQTETRIVFAYDVLNSRHQQEFWKMDEVLRCSKSPEHPLLKSKVLLQSSRKGMHNGREVSFHSSNSVKGNKNPKIVCRKHTLTT